MSKKPRDEFDRIIMDEEMKKRILHKVFDDNSEVKSIEDYRIKKNILVRKRLSGIAACFTVVMCLNAVKNYPQLFKDKFDNLKQEEITEDTQDKNAESELELKNNENDKLKEGGINDKSGNRDNYKNNKDDSNKNQKKDDIEQGGNLAKADNNENIRDSVIKNPISVSNEGTGIDIDNKTPETIVPENNTNANGVLNSVGSPSTNGTPNEEESHVNSGENNEHTNVTPPSESLEPGESAGDVLGGEQSSDNLGDPLQGVQVPDNSEDLSQGEQLPGDSSQGEQLPSSGENSSGGQNSAFEKECTRLEEAEEIVNLKINSIKELPDKFEIQKVSVLCGEIIQITYTDDLEEKIVFRAGKDVENISGDYNIYSFNDKCEIVGVSVKLKGNDENQIKLAEWKKGDISYSISAEYGISQAGILKMIDSSL